MKDNLQNVKQPIHPLIDYQKKKRKMFILIFLLNSDVLIKTKPLPSDIPLKKLDFDGNFIS
jgi:hypothetical protein